LSGRVLLNIVYYQDDDGSKQQHIYYRRTITRWIHLFLHAVVRIPIQSGSAGQHNQRSIMIIPISYPTCQIPYIVNCISNTALTFDRREDMPYTREAGLFPGEAGPS
jgi:hypothetical protein